MSNPAPSCAVPTMPSSKPDCDWLVTSHAVAPAYSRRSRADLQTCRSRKTTPVPCLYILHPSARLEPGGDRRYRATSTEYEDDRGNRDVRLAGTGIRRWTRLPPSSVTAPASRGTGVGAGRRLCCSLTARRELRRVLVRLPVGGDKCSDCRPVASLPMGTGSGIRERQERNGTAWTHGWITDQAVAESADSNGPARQMENSQSSDPSAPSTEFSPAITLLRAPVR